MATILNVEKVRNRKKIEKPCVVGSNIPQTSTNIFVPAMLIKTGNDRKTTSDPYLVLKQSQYLRFNEAARKHLSTQLHLPWVWNSATMRSTRAEKSTMKTEQQVWLI